MATWYCRVYVCLQAEVEATRNVFSLQEDAHSIDASVLARYAYLALARKLRYMPPAKLAALHANVSFTQVYQAAEVFCCSAVTADNNHNCRHIDTIHFVAIGVQPETEMQESLFLLEPPPRKALIGEVHDTNYSSMILLLL